MASILAMTLAAPAAGAAQVDRTTTTLVDNCELLLSTESQTNRFRNVFRDGFEQVSRLHFTSTFLNHLTGETQDCEVEFHIAHDELRWGSQELVCEGDGGGGGGEG